MATALEYELLFKRYDHDGDGVIEQSDLDLLNSRWCTALHVPPGSRQWYAITRHSNRLWHHLPGTVNADGDKVVSVRQWVSAHDDAAFVERVAIPWAVSVFDMGADDDGRVSLAVWMATQSVSDYPQIDSLRAFQRLDENGDGYLDREPFTKYIEAFYSRVGEPVTA
jgi:Ca2+-binding EF-hand superfamily protein